MKKIRILLFVVSISIVSSCGLSAEAHLPGHNRISDSARKSNRNYANACTLLLKKRTAKSKPSKNSKVKLPKWR